MNNMLTDGVKRVMNMIRSDLISSICGRSYLLANLQDLLLTLPQLLLLIIKGKALDPYSRAQIIGTGQSEEEIRWAAEIISRQQPRYLLELGTYKGGNAVYLSHYMAENGTIVTIDLSPRIVFETARINYQRKSERRRRDGGRQQRKPFMVFSRGCTRFRKAVLGLLAARKCNLKIFYTYLRPEHDAKYIYSTILNGELFDVIFYDADKSEHGVNALLDAYLPLLKINGLLIIQDINYALDSGNNGMRLYWENLPNDRFHRVGECIVAGGIGVAVKLR